MYCRHNINYKPRYPLQTANFKGPLRNQALSELEYFNTKVYLVSKQCPTPVNTVRSVPIQVQLNLELRVLLKYLG